MAKSKKLTPKQEKFCQKYIELGNASEAYRQSYKCDRMKDGTINSRAKELLKNGPITVRINQLKAEHKARHNLTVDDLLRELEEARTTALTCETPQASAAVSATMGKAKILGLDKQIFDHTSSDGSMTPKQGIDLSGLTDDELRQLNAIAVKSRTDTGGAGKA